MPLRHVVMLINFRQEIAHADPEAYFCQSVLLMYGTVEVTTAAVIVAGYAGTTLSGGR